MFEAKATGVRGVVELRPLVRTDKRGRFVKTIQSSTYLSLGLRTDFAEQYVSTSHEGVVRGLHFQSPPFDHAKLVYCVRGRVFDAIVDLRPGEQYGRHAHVYLDAEECNLLYLPAGMAHGFWTVSSEAILVYNVTSEYSSEHDSGILWSSAGIPWPGTHPVVSERDQGLLALSEFETPFQ